MNNAQEFTNLYTNISQNITNAMYNLSNLRVDHQEGKQKLDNISKVLSKIQGQFNAELEFHEKHSEWDKFTIAFFGETNAGKSTIIDSLRIIFEETERQKLIEQNSGNLEKLEKELNEKIRTIQIGLNEVYASYISDFTQIDRDLTSLKETINNESVKRIRKKLIASGVAGFVAGAFVMFKISSIFGA